MDAPPRPIDAVRQMLKDLLGGPDASIAHRRRQSEVFAAAMPPLPADILSTAATLGGVPVERLRTDGPPTGRVFLHLHGGGYVMGDPAGSRGFTVALARASAVEVVSVDYRLGPTHPFPAAVDDAAAVYAALLETGLSPDAIAIGGESAGGGLAVAALLAARDQGLPLPACCVAMSPWADLACQGDSYVTRQDGDPLLTRGVLLEMARDYLAGADAAQPYASPARADLTGLPPLLIQVGADEVLLDDATVLADRARACGVDVDLQVWPGMIHVWQMFAGLLPEADEAISKIAEMLKRHWGPT